MKEVEAVKADRTMIKRELTLAPMGVVSASHARSEQPLSA